MKEYVANTVQELRLESGITQEELAERVGVSRQTIIAIEKGNYAPSVILALRIAGTFKVTLEKVFYIAYEK